MNYSKSETPLARVFGAPLVLLGAAILAGSPAAAASADAPVEQVLFVCEHGNVKSVMAAAYFNQLAAERNLRLRAVSRGAAANPASVPPTIVEALQTEGIDVSQVQPLALSPRDAFQSRHVVSIGAELPRTLQEKSVEQWRDVPAASTHYAAARDSLRAHVSDLLDRLSGPVSQ